MVRKLFWFVLPILLGGCSLVGIRSGTEQPDYEVVASLTEDIEIRRYGPRLAAEVSMPSDSGEDRNAAFRVLADYIFGNNKAGQAIEMTAPVSTEPQSEEIAMTAPVATAPGPEGHVMRFFLPADYTLDTAPRPVDPRVSLVLLPGETVAALTFTGSRSDQAVAERQRTLLAALSASDWRAAGSPGAFFYDPPWTIPFLRRNEAVVGVTR